MQELILTKEGLIKKAKTYFFRDSYDLCTYLESFINPETTHLLYGKNFRVNTSLLSVVRSYEDSTSYILYVEDRRDLNPGVKLEIGTQEPDSVGIMPSRARVLRESERGKV